IDEISIGLDKKTLNNIILKLDKLGENNNIWLIDHSDQVLNSSEHTIFFGPGSGPDGGKIVKESPRPRPIYYPINKERIDDHFYFSELRFRNIDLKKLSLPKNRIVGVTGASGCGKSTLVN
ncbi:hypothetical protein QMU85_003982, partial [Photobacterium damselae]|nr:hypothetical protein [Photobacterium damselae]